MFKMRTGRIIIFKFLEINSIENKIFENLLRKFLNNKLENFKVWGYFKCIIAPRLG